MIRKRLLCSSLLGLLIMGSSLTAFAIESPIPSPRPSQDMVGFHKWFQERLYLSRDQWDLYHSGSLGKYEYDFDITGVTIRNFNDYLAVWYYLIETTSDFEGKDIGFILNELRSYDDYILDRELIFLERASQGICDKYAILYGAVGAKGYNTVALKRWKPISICMDKFGEANGDTKEWMKRFVGPTTNLLKMELMKSGYFSPDVRSKIGLFYLRSTRGCRRQGNCTVDDYIHTFRTIWEKWGKEAVENYVPPRELNFERGKELYAQYGQNFPQPAWVQAMREINEKTPEEWEKEIRDQMGEAGDSVKVKYNRDAKRYFEEERKKKQKQAAPVTKSASKPAPKPDTVSDSDPDSNVTLWILGILALLSALIVSVIVIRRRR